MIDTAHAILLSLDDARLLVAAIQAGEPDWDAAWTRVANRAPHGLAAADVAVKLRDWVEMKDRELYGSVDDLR